MRRRIRPTSSKVAWISRNRHRGAAIEPMPDRLSGCQAWALGDDGLIEAFKGIFDEADDEAG
jgi:hypothetical protein